MRKIDEESIKIYNMLLLEYESNIEESSQYLNIFGVFMHEIMIYLTNYIILKESEYSYSGDVKIPFTNTKYVNSPYEVDVLNEIETLAVNSKRKAINSLLEFTFFGKKIAFSDGTSKELIYYGLKKIYKYNFEYIGNPKCCLPNKNKQLERLNNFIDKFCNIYAVKNKEIFTKNILNYIKSFLTDEEIDFLKSDVFFSGSLSLIQNRIIAAHFLEKNKLVISLAHGEQDMLTLDDPYAGYADMSYCTYYISYGSEIVNNGVYNNSLKGHNVNVLKRTSKVIEKIYKSPIIDTRNNSFEKGLYIPTGFCDRFRYGPFRDIDDEDYKKWQSELFKFQSNLYYKEHPSRRDKVTIATNLVQKEENILYENLMELNIKTFDYLVLDFMSTAYAISAATELPILYFNLGLMNISESVVNDIKERVFWVDIDFNDDINTQISIAFSNFYKKLTYYNKYSEKYCLAENNLENTINKILK